MQNKWCQKIMETLPQRRIPSKNVEGRNEKSFKISSLNTIVIITAGKMHWWMLKLVSKTFRRNRVFAEPQSTSLKLFINYYVVFTYLQMLIFLPPGDILKGKKVKLQAELSDSFLTNLVREGKTQQVYRRESWQTLPYNQVININIIFNKSCCYHVPQYDVRRRVLHSSVVFPPKFHNPSLIMRKHLINRLRK